MRGTITGVLVLSLLLAALSACGTGEREPAPALSEQSSQSQPPQVTEPLTGLPDGEGLSDWSLTDFTLRFREVWDTEYTSYLIGEGTEAENTVQVLHGQEEGPALYIVAGVHGDERAGWYAGELMKKGTLRAGTVYVLSPANRYGAEQDRRTTKSDRDLNRNFPGDPEGWDAEQIAYAIYRDIREKAPALVLDLHEARPQQGQRDALGNTMICQEVEPIGDLVLELLTRSESGELGSSPLSLYGSPPQGSINKTVTQELGIPVITVETSRAEPMAQRVDQQLAIVEFVLSYYNMY